MAKSEVEDVIFLYEDRLLDMLRDTTMSESEKKDRAKALFSEFAEEAYKQGQITAGGDGVLDEDDAKLVDEWVDSQLPYVPTFSEFLSANPQDMYPLLDEDDAKKQHEDRTDERTNWWLVALAGLAGIAALNMWGEQGQEGMWLTGNRVKHCMTCSALNGMVAKLDWFVDNRYIPRQPGSPTLACNGYKCGCRIVDPKTLEQIYPLVEIRR